MNAKGYVAVLCTVCLLGTAVPSRGDSPLGTGIQQAQEGEYAAAVATLRGVVERLVSNPQASADLKTAYVYLGVAHLGLEQENDARRVFVSALKLDPALALKTTDFPPRVVRFFEKVHQEAIAAGTVKAPPKVAAKKSGGSGTTLLLVGGGVAAAGVGAVVLLGGKKTNKAPVPGTIDVTPKFTGIASATEFTLAANGFSDPDGDVLTYTWNFGDGGAGQGQSVKHVFGAPSQFTVTVTASDGKGGQATSQPASVAVKSLQARWQSTQGNIVRTWFIQQAGTTLGGTYTNTSCAGNGTLTGTASNPRNVHIDAAISCYDHCLFDGVLDDAANNLSGNACGAQLTFTRQP
jgi:hypothetical protein